MINGDRNDGFRFNGAAPKQLAARLLSDSLLAPYIDVRGGDGMAENAPNTIDV